MTNYLSEMLELIVTVMVLWLAAIHPRVYITTCYSTPKCRKRENTRHTLLYIES